LRGYGDRAGARVFERAQAGLAHVRTVGAHVVVTGLVPFDRTMTLPGSELPVERLHVVHWLRHPHRHGCGAKLECARADLDVSAAARELRPILPPLPFDPGSVDSAKVDLAIGRSDGVLRRARLEGDLDGLRLEVDLDVTRRS
jgi:hypothetical protein